VQREIDNRRRAAERSRSRAAGEVVGGDRPAEGHIEMRVRIDEAGENIRPRRVDNRSSRRRKRAGDGSDRTVLDQNVGDEVIRRCYDRAAFYDGIDSRSLHVCEL
jgi:hypothetical protein